MIGRKETVLIAVIFAALITVGLLLSCGDDDVAPTCQNACKKLAECEWIDNDDVEECVDSCEEALEEYEEEIIEAIECIMENDCEDIADVCYGGEEPSCQDACERLDDCDLIPGDFGEDVADCVDICEGELDQYDIECIMETVCEDIIVLCFGWEELSCQAACERLAECEWIDNDDVEECVDNCEESVGIDPEGTMEFIECIMETPCDDIEDDCF